MYLAQENKSREMDSAQGDRSRQPLGKLDLADARWGLDRHFGV